MMTPPPCSEDMTCAPRTPSERRRPPSLRHHASAGRITIDELAGRFEAVYTARTRGQLHDLIADLPIWDASSPSWG